MLRVRPFAALFLSYHFRRMLYVSFTLQSLRET